MVNRKRKIVSSIYHSLVLSPITHRLSTLLETAPEEIRHLDKECPTVAAKSRLDAMCERAKAVVVQVVVIADVKGRAGIRRPAHQELAAHARGERIVINARPCKREACELISASQHEDVF